VQIYAGKVTEMPELVKGLEEQLHECNQRLLSQATFTAIKTKRHEYILGDIDTSVMNNEGTKKEQIGWTYKGVKGIIRYSRIVGRRDTCCRASCGREASIARRGRRSF
jgi:Na+-transporting NADH:ubiquinone oxidoreductase subunit NqrA